MTQVVPWRGPVYIFFFYSYWRNDFGKNNLEIVCKKKKTDIKKQGLKSLVSDFL